MQKSKKIRFWGSETDKLPVFSWETDKLKLFFEKFKQTLLFSYQPRGFVKKSFLTILESRTARVHTALHKILENLPLLAKTRLNASEVFFVILYLFWSEQNRIEVRQIVRFRS